MHFTHNKTKLLPFCVFQIFLNFPIKRYSTRIFIIIYKTFIAENASLICSDFIFPGKIELLIFVFLWTQKNPQFIRMRCTFW